MIGIYSHHSAEKNNIKSGNCGFFIKNFFFFFFLNKHIKYIYMGGIQTIHKKKLEKDNKRGGHTSLATSK